MPFLGKTPKQVELSSFGTRVKDNFTANGSTTAFTLSKSVANPNDIAVFVGNVRQEPTDAYTVNGTTLTMSEAPATGLNFYAIHTAGTIESSVVPADNTISTAKIASSAVTKSKIGTTELDLATIKDSTGTNTAMTIDSNGTVLMPQKPAWRLGLSPAQVETAVGTHDILFNKTTGQNCFVQGNLTYTAATGVLEVGVAGVYQINTVVRIDDIGSGYLVLRIVINNDVTGASETYSIEGAPASNYQTLTNSDTFKLAAGDNIRITIYSSTDTSWSIADNTAFFSGFLVG